MYTVLSEFGMYFITCNYQLFKHLKNNKSQNLQYYNLIILLSIQYCKLIILMSTLVDKRDTALGNTWRKWCRPS